ncbi:outer membrane porin, OprD family, partial [Pseudomonas sp. CrR25]|nr:outer membrane porin, OprD family [Pseudomonas sp. CrR25]
KKKYINLNYNLPMGEAQALNLDFNAYKTNDTGKNPNKIDNKIWSLAAAYSLGAHTFTLAHQRSSGDTAYVYGIDGNGTVWLANSIQLSDFDRKDERSWQARYDLNMASYGVPGLSFMARYVTGDNIDYGVGVDEGEENEFNFETKYVLQEGAAKDLSFRIRSSIYRANNSQNANYSSDLNDFRLIVEYPLEVL